MSTSSKQPWWREALTFSRSERIGILVLLVLVISVWWVPAMFGRKRGVSIPDIRIDSLVNSLPSTEKQVDRFARPQQGTNHRSVYTPEKVPEPFPFDPNEASAEEWQRLGLSDRTIATIQRFREKGGRFRKPEDIVKIYGLSVQHAERLIPYVRIYNRKPDRPDSSVGKSRFSKVPPRVLDINQADSAAWESLPGIGPTLAGRIIKYRNRLGGFHRISQVGETYGLADSVFRSIEQRLRLENVHPSGLIPINSATFEQLSAHPYIPFRLAKALIAYRDQHGPYKNKEDLMRIAIISTEMLDKILPYLQFDQ